MKILVLNGPNLNLLGRREPDIYGRLTLADIEESMRGHARKCGVEVDFFQSNDEGALVSRIGEAAGLYDGLIFNPAAYTHTSVALRDALMAVKRPCVEVHLSNPQNREDFRQANLTLGACIGQVSGFRDRSYILAMDGLIHYLKNKS